MFLVLAGMALVQYRRAGRRSASDVYQDLVDGEESEEGSVRKKNVGRDRVVLNDQLSKIGLFQPDERRRYLQRRRVMPIAGGLVGLAVTVIAGTDDPVVVVVGVGAMAGLFELAARKGAENRAAQLKRDLEFYLPLVMERLVMAVQAGHDVISGLRTVIELEERKRKETPAAARTREPVTELLSIGYRLAARGVRVEEAFRSVAMSVESPSFRHALIHLGLAHKEGGELIGPLRELSDSTQNYFQETVEEEIAKLPVRATVPLLLMFAGLIISFLVNPILAVMNTLNSIGLES